MNLDIFLYLEYLLIMKLFLDLICFIALQLIINIHRQINYLETPSLKTGKQNKNDLIKSELNQHECRINQDTYML